MVLSAMKVEFKTGVLQARGSEQAPPRSEAAVPLRGKRRSRSGG
ncbi:hypothetical protein P353_11710 [Comamonas testosteroni]|uniref:Uncharacterized protein n=1 Tax=Comamonas testosteroni TaxID=285 RepID=A0A096FK02_COMTE|nr:hypothetical protein P353_11710 [Comamonas testosteroni]